MHPRGECMHKIRLTSENVPSIIMLWISESKLSALWYIKRINVLAYIPEINKHFFPHLMKHSTCDVFWALHFNTRLGLVSHHQNIFIAMSTLLSLLFPASLYLWLCICCQLLVDLRELADECRERSPLTMATTPLSFERLKTSYCDGAL